VRIASSAPMSYGRTPTMFPAAFVPSVFIAHLGYCREEGSSPGGRAGRRERIHRDAPRCCSRNTFRSSTVTRTTPRPPLVEKVIAGR